MYIFLMIFLGIFCCFTMWSHKATSDMLRDDYEKARQDEALASQNLKRVLDAGGVDGEVIIYGRWTKSPVLYMRFADYTDTCVANCPQDIPSALKQLESHGFNTTKASADFAKNKAGRKILEIAENK